MQQNPVVLSLMWLHGAGSWCFISHVTACSRILLFCVSADCLQQDPAILSLIWLHWVAIQFCSIKIPRNKPGTVFDIPRKKVLIQRNYMHLEIAYYEVPNRTERIPQNNEAILKLRTDEFLGKTRFGWIDQITTIKYDLIDSFVACIIGEGIKHR
jgi:hypothetical protein